MFLSTSAASRGQSIFIKEFCMFSRQLQQIWDFWSRIWAVLHLENDGTGVCQIFVYPSWCVCTLLHSSQEMVGVVGVVWNSLLWDTYLHKNSCKIQSTPHLTLCKWWMDSTDAVTVRTDWNLSKVRRPRWWAWNVRVWCPDKLWANNHCSSSNRSLRHKLQNPLGERERVE